MILRQGGIPALQNVLPMHAGPASLGTLLAVPPSATESLCIIPGVRWMISVVANKLVNNGVKYVAKTGMVDTNWNHFFIL